MECRWAAQRRQGLPQGRMLSVAFPAALLCVHRQHSGLESQERSGALDGALSRAAANSEAQPESRPSGLKKRMHCVYFGRSSVNISSFHRNFETLDSKAFEIILSGSDDNLKSKPYVKPYVKCWAF